MGVRDNNSYNTIVLGAFKFPEGDVAASYVLGIGNLLLSVGLSPLFLGIQSEQAGIAEYANFSYVSDGCSHNNATVRMVSALTHMSHSAMRLKQYDNDSVKYIIAYLPSVYLTHQLVDYCKKKGKKLIICVTEWYELDSVTLGRCGPFALDSELRLRKSYWHADALIVISRYLANYYSGMKTIIIPPTLDVINTSHRISSKTNNCLKLSYTGNPGKKDLIYDVINAIERVDPNGEYIEFTIAGLNSTQLRRLFGEYPRNIKAIGRIPHSSAMQMTMDSDFSILFRRPLRYAMAGFATKVPESLSVGTHIICNPTGDLPIYLTDNKDSIIVENHTVDSISQALNMALSMSIQERSNMRKEARDSALRHFDYRSFSSSFTDFLNAL